MLLTRESLFRHCIAAGGLHARNRCARTNAGSVAANASASAGTAYTGMGGPDTSAYPMCSRAVTDSPRPSTDMR